jgi:hypothetical protein
MLGTLNIHQSTPRPTHPPPPPSLSEAGRVEDLKAAHEEGSALRASVWGKEVGVLIPMEATSTDATSCTDSGRADEAEPRPKDPPGEAAFAPESPRGSGFSPPREVALDDVMPILESSILLT